MFKKRLLLSTVAILAALLSNFAFAASIVNGNFNTDLTGWSVYDNTIDSSPNGLATWSSEQALLTTGSGTSGLSAAIDQGFTDSGFAITLGSNEIFSFNAVFTRGSTEDEGSVSSFIDALNVVMYDMGSSGNVYQLFNIDYLTSATLFSIDLSAYSGATVGFSFELADESDGYNSSVALDNIRLEQRAVNAVPLPSTLLLVIIGWFGLVRNVVRADQKVQS